MPRASPFPPSATGRLISRDDRSGFILVVDDERLDRRVIVEVLVDDGHVVVESPSGEHALRLAAQHPFDLVVCDLRMPRMSGTDVVAALQASAVTRTIPVILVTAADDVDTRVDGLDAGAVDYVVKPFAPDELRARVRAHLRARAAWTDLLRVRMRQRAAVGESIARAMMLHTAEARAAVLCDELVAMGVASGAAILWFTPDGGAVPLGVAGSGVWGLRPGVGVPERFAAYLATRAAGGPWIDHGRDGATATATMTPMTMPMTTADPLLVEGPLACAPLGRPTEHFGVLVLSCAPAIDAGRPRPAVTPPTEALTTAIDLAGLGTGLLAEELQRRRREYAGRESVATVLRSRGFIPYFQPIRVLRDRRAVGFEALTRFADGTPPDVRFAEAARVGLAGELEQATLVAALDHASSLPGPTWLSINLSPSVVAESDGLGALLHDAGRPVVVEITEHEPVDDYDALRAALNRVGLDVSVDDAGSGFASLRHILVLRPAYIKLDRSWVFDIDTDLARQALVAGLQSFATNTGCRIIAEGIETEGQLAKLVELGVALGQGYLLGAPAPAAQWSK
jgi:EAL domain-containing protein (putative c-di-GMP-specific phosphodiesterase class I)/CheY-like chemotaxis protein